MAAGTLTLSSKLTPFPYSAIAIAAYTEKSEIVYDEAATSVLLDLNGSKIDTEEEIVHALAKAGGLSEDSAKVFCRTFTVKESAYFVIRQHHSLRLQKLYVLSLLSQRS